MLILSWILWILPWNFFVLNATKKITNVQKKREPRLHIFNIMWRLQGSPFIGLKNHDFLSPRFYFFCRKIILFLFVEWEFIVKDTQIKITCNMEICNCIYMYTVTWKFGDIILLLPDKETMLYLKCNTKDENQPEHNISNIKRRWTLLNET